MMASRVKVITPTRKLVLSVIVIHSTQQPDQWQVIQDAVWARQAVCVQFSKANSGQRDCNELEVNEWPSCTCWFILKKLQPNRLTGFNLVVFMKHDYYSIKFSPSMFTADMLCRLFVAFLYLVSPEPARYSTLVFSKPEEVCVSLSTCNKV